MSSSSGAEALPKKDHTDTVTKETVNVCIVEPLVGCMICETVRFSGPGEGKFIFRYFIFIFYFIFLFDLFSRLTINQI